MITLLRKIRKRLIGEKNFSSYLLYAIGEILLVVIGILLALQINNWNENRKRIADERILAKELYQELQRNLEYIDDELNGKFVKGRVEALRNLLSLTSQPEPNIEFGDFNKLYELSSSYQVYSPIRNKTDRILNLENFTFSQSETLYDELLAYYNSLQNVKEYYDLIDATWKLANQPFLIEHYPLRNFYWLPEDIRGSRHQVDHIKMLKDQKFESLLASIMADVYGYEKRLKLNRDHIHTLIEILKSDYSLVNK